MQSRWVVRRTECIATAVSEGDGLVWPGVAIASCVSRGARNLDFTAKYLNF